MTRARTSLTQIVRACLLAAPLALAAVPATAQTTGPAFAPGRILVMPKPGLPEPALQALLRERGAGTARRLGRSELRVVTTPAGQERAVLQRLANHPHLKFAELDEAIVPGGAPNDPLYGSQWHLPKIGADLAWESATGSGVTIAILDSGVDPTHADLSARLVPGWNFYDNNSNTSDVFGHGTRVAGAAAAATGNATGVAGLAGQARIMPIRITDTAGSGYFSAAASGLTWAADNGARVANLSFSGMQRSAAVTSAAQYFRSKGGVVTVSAGNTSGEVTDIAPSEHWLAVSATTSTDSRSSFSSWGTYVDLAAPGSSIYTTSRGGGYGAVNGTSFAAPLAAGAAALVMAAKPGLTPAQVESILLSSAVDLGAAGKDTTFGAGRLDARAAVALAANTSAPAVDTQAPTVAIGNPAGGSTVSGVVVVDVAASDNTGVARVELSANGQTVGTDSAAPFSFAWDSRLVANGAATLVARAYDAAGNLASSGPVSVSVSNIADTTAPRVSIANPTQGATVSGVVAISVNATDDAGTATLRQRLLIGGKLVASTTGGSLSFNWNTKRLKSGTYTITAEATDAAGNRSTASVTVNR